MNAVTTRLLVSVRNAAEAEAALQGGASLIDVKEPLRGALGAADAATLDEVLAFVAGRAPVSAALGELIDWPERAFTPPAGLAFAKFGLAGASRLADWPAQWRAALASLPPHTAPVAVVYADWQTSAAPAPSEVLRVARELGCGTLLIDTFDKQGGDLLTRWPLESLGAFTAEVRRAKLRVVLGGSLSLARMHEVLPLAPDYLAVRTAACRAGRTSEICAARVSELAAICAARTTVAVG